MSSTEGSEEKDSVRVWVDGVCAMYPVSQLETLASGGGGLTVHVQCLFVRRTLVAGSDDVRRRTGHPVHLLASSLRLQLPVLWAVSLAGVLTLPQLVAGKVLTSPRLPTVQARPYQSERWPSCLRECAAGRCSTL